MTDSPLQNSGKPNLVSRPTPRNTKIEDIDPVLLDWNQTDLEPTLVERPVELRKIEPVEHDSEEGHLVKRLDGLRHALGDAWKSMEQTVDEAVKSISSGRNL